MPPMWPVKVVSNDTHTMPFLGNGKVGTVLTVKILHMYLLLLWNICHKNNLMCMFLFFFFFSFTECPARCSLSNSCKCFLNPIFKYWVLCSNIQSCFVIRQLVRLSPVQARTWVSKRVVKSTCKLSLPFGMILSSALYNSLCSQRAEIHLLIMMES